MSPSILFFNIIIIVFPIFSPCIDGKQKTHSAHKTVADIFIGPCPESYQVNHKNGIKTDNRVENLEYVTPSENIRHAYRNNLMSRRDGEYNGRSKLTKADVNRILKSYPILSQAKLSRKFNVHPSTIRKIVIGRTWKNR